MTAAVLGCLLQAAKAIRSGFACVGAVVDAVAPLKPVFGHPLPNPARDTDQQVIDSLTNVHPPHWCAGQTCVIHNRSDHHMRGWELNWRNDRGIFERICPHGIGHPDPDQFEFWEAARKAWRPSIAADVIDDPYPPGNPYEGIGVHGCDGCCRPPESPAVSATGAVEEPSPAGAPVPAGDVPHTIHGAPTFAVLQALLTEYAVDHGELRFDGGADHWSCQCGQALPDGGDGAYAALRDHCIELQASALSFAIAEARNTQK